MLKTNKFATLAILAALTITPAFAADKPAAVVNGVAIAQDRVEMNVKGAVAQGQPDSPELRKAIREDLISREVMVQAASKSGLDKTADVVQQMEIARQTVLVNAYVQDVLKKNPVGEDQLKKAYETLKAKLGDKEYNARHILVASEAEAKDIIAKLGKKAKFEQLAKSSIDTGSAAQGGALGWTVPKNFVEPFANALLNLKKGEYTKIPVKTQFGWHVIKLDDVRSLKVPGYNELKPQLQQRLQQQTIQKAIADLRATAKIE
ncbi:MAG: peptidylprolyl isomerase [Gallionellales bacterium CG_4_10_14_3_um_filter_54_96]|nr:MAG: peptidylprolyl isomerase [Gallionellaceae bacterium CG1_02_56_997]OIO82099.1 MAG: peptidylprolyl isomerase [Gallionellaceae bacterium CG1_02_60_948]PIV14576.1 MAG: peptidylprolyl isomerase [Gallionellales bacterium CG03_land_8_20_14_0_80_55_15]PIV91567.1 MAG: peptidylprolyl isomerase [Gallionellales bacterium CG17_big_fil_post_rev_8_21_14_2_50_54_146]PIX03647.1 MAG: peptidylprolyl isomerase [Gallionellales bacterium CG_4_8_14_3_um_filter_54_18]PIY04336.1 MAG: peptidylprolyl isomerase [